VPIRPVNLTDIQDYAKKDYRGTPSFPGEA
jgi:hypothetical protein